MSRPGVIFGGPSPEHDISILTGLMAARALTTSAQEVHCLYWSKGGDWHLVPADLEGDDFADGVPRGSSPVRLVVGPGGGFVGAGALRKERPLDLSAVLNCCHGAPGEDGTLQGALDLAGIAHGGPSAAGAALGMDKLAFGALVVATGLPSLSRALVEPVDGWAPAFPGPYIVKPRFGGSSIGIEVVADAAAVGALMRNSIHLRNGAVVEPYRAGADEVQIAVRAFPELQVSNLLRPKRSAASGEIYSYKEKYVPGEGMHAAQGEIDPELPAGVAPALQAAAKTLAVVARVRGVARVDFLLEGDQWFVNEINTIPGSLAKHLWVNPAVPVITLVNDVLAEAVQRSASAAWTTAGADGTALRSAGSIAGKLG